MSTVSCGTSYFIDPAGSCDDNLPESVKTCNGCYAQSVNELNNIWSNRVIDPDNPPRILNCRRVMHNIIYDEQNDYDPNEYTTVNKYFNYLMDVKFDKQFGCRLSSVENDANCVAFRNNMLDYCNNDIAINSVPGGCDNYLCQIACPSVSYDSLGVDQSLANWCGCYVSPPEETATAITNGTQNAVYLEPDTGTIVHGPVGSFPCFPMCHTISGVGLYDPTNGRKYACRRNVCVIDDVRIASVESTLGSVNIQQICPFCTIDSGTSCTCIISSPDLTTSFDELGIETNFSQYCGDNSVCYSLDDTTGQLTNVTCSNFTSSDKSVDIVAAAPWVLLIIVIVLVIVIVIVLLFSRGRKTKVEKVTIENGHVNVSEISPNV